jgi:short-subunit dehydrogenase
MSRWQRALITGASAGIGREFARQLAAQGTDLVVVARRADRLADLAHELEPLVHTEVVVADLADQADLERVARRVRSTTDPIDLLINNAGIAGSADFTHSTIEQQAAVIALNVTALVTLSHAAVPPMTARGTGTIINISSIAGNQPRGGFGVYGATKAFVTSFSQSLASDLEGTGVGCTVVLPGLTATEFQEANGIVDRSPALLWMPADAVVAQSLAAAAIGRRLVIPGTVNKALTVVSTPRPGRLRARATRAAVAVVKRSRS